MKYRSRMEIVRQILDIAREDLDGITKTSIMYKAYLSFAQLKEYTAMLIESGLIEHVKETNTYRTTPKGIQMLEACQQVNQMIEG